MVNYPATRAGGFLPKELLFISKDNESYILAIGPSPSLVEPQCPSFLRSELEVSIEETPFSYPSCLTCQATGRCHANTIIIGYCAS